MHASWPAQGIIQSRCKMFTMLLRSAFFSFLFFPFAVNKTCSRACENIGPAASIKDFVGGVICLEGDYHSERPTQEAMHMQ